MQMDQFEAARVLHERIKSFEPEDVVFKIVGYIYMQNYPKHEMIRLAMGPDELIHKLIHKVKLELRLYSTPSLSPPISPSMSPSPISDQCVQFGPFSPASPLPHTSPVAFGMCGPYWKRATVGGQQPMHKFDVLPVAYHGALREEPGFHNHSTSEVQPEQINFHSYDFSGDFFGNGDIEGNRNSVKTCHYFNKGFCKHGSNCRYFHGQQFPDNCLQGVGFYSSESAFDDHVVSPRSLEKLEVEITELLKSRRGNPVSIASLPMMYYEKYGRTLQAEGYLTESQRHGKAGFSLTKLLARLRNILLIDRPHGQHSVILAEDAPKYMELHGERNDPGPIVCGSRQIYLTFPAESSFTEEDVCDYFNTFGPVQDVRIPCQQKRMFGFVTFASADTVKMILSRGNPHYICGARVLVKPYREKSKLVERKYQEQFEHPMCFQLDDINVDHERHARWSVRLQKEQLMKEHEHALELEARRLSQLYLAKKPLPIQSCFGRSLEDLKISDDCSKHPLAESSLYPCDDELKKPCSKYTELDRNDGHNLPDSPFEMPVASSIPSI